MTNWIVEEADFVLTDRARGPNKVFLRMATTALALASTASFGGWLLYAPFNGAAPTKPLFEPVAPFAQIIRDETKTAALKKALARSTVGLLDSHYSLGAIPQKLARLSPQFVASKSHFVVAHAAVESLQQVALAKLDLPPQTPISVETIVPVPIPQPRPGGLAPTFSRATAPIGNESTPITSETAAVTLETAAVPKPVSASPTLEIPLPPERAASIEPHPVKQPQVLPPVPPLVARQAQAHEPAPHLPKAVEAPREIVREIPRPLAAPSNSNSKSQIAIAPNIAVPPEQASSARPMVSAAQAVQPIHMTARQRRLAARQVRRLAQQNRTTEIAAIHPDKRSFFEKIFGGNSSNGQALAYASTQAGASGFGNALSSSAAPSAGTAVYNIAAHTVTLPNGERLEAHSGLGAMLDNPASVNQRMRGATPPHIYDLTPREALFHGVAALRLTPVGGGSVYGRTGLLAHTFMLGPRGDSNGCISFRNYNAFLQAYRNGQIRRLVVVTGRG